MVNISSGVTLFIRWLPLVFVASFGCAALYAGLVKGEAEAVLGAAAVGVTFGGLWFLVYSRSLWTVFVRGDRVVLKKPGKSIETQVSNIRRVELFPDILSRGERPQYELIFREPVAGFISARFYPNHAGMKWLDELMAKMRRLAVQRRRR